MQKSAVFPIWGRILRGYKPFLSIEVTRECPLRCPGCYAYEPQHLNNGTLLRQLSDYQGSPLVNGILELARRHRPLHISIVGGEPLVRYRELGEVLPKLDAMGIEVQLVTSAVRPIPAEWAGIPSLHLAVSVDGLQPEHDVRRAPATYDRILKNIVGHRVVIHCTVTRQMLARESYLREFAEFWAPRPEVRKVWFSLFTPQQGELSAERLSPEERLQTIDRLGALHSRIPKVEAPPRALDGLRKPPSSPEECVFARLTECVSADLETRITPCQFGGQPVCSECGCFASAGLAAIGDFKLGGMVRIFDILSASQTIGARLGGTRNSRPAEAV